MGPALVDRHGVGGSGRPKGRGMSIGDEGGAAAAGDRGGPPEGRGVRVAYLIPEFPGQTHIWMWREIVHLREWGADVRLFSTRRPPERDRARHDFAPAAEAETVYLSPLGFGRALRGAAGAMLRRPWGVARAAWLGLTLPVEDRPRWRRVLPLLGPACVMAAEARAAGVEHVQVHSCARSAIIAMMVNALSGIPYSLTVNANLDWWGGAMEEKLGRAAFVIAIAEWLREDILRRYPRIPAERVVLGRIGVDTVKWRPAPERAREGGRFVAVSVGRLHESKAHDDTIRAVGRLAKAGHDVELRILGGGPEEDSLRALVEREGLSDRVRLLGSVSEARVFEELYGAHAFVLASHAEPLGVVYMEAMAAGVATVGTRAGGVPEIIEDGVTGILVEPRNVESLAAGLERLILDDGLRRRIARAGRAAVEAKFDSRLGAAELLRQIVRRRAGAVRAWAGAARVDPPAVARS